MTGTPIRVGIIGAHPERGWAATAHLSALKQLPQFRVTTVSHHSLETAQAAAAKFGIPNASPRRRNWSIAPTSILSSFVVALRGDIASGTTAVGVSGKGVEPLP